MTSGWNDWQIDASHDQAAESADRLEPPVIRDDDGMYYCRDCKRIFDPEDLTAGECALWPERDDCPRKSSSETTADAVVREQAS